MLLIPILRVFFRRFDPSSPWNDKPAVRQELFGGERLEQHARSLAAAQAITAKPPVVPSLHARLRDNARVLRAAYKASAEELESGQGQVPAAKWLLDNYHLVETQIREIRNDMPPGYYRQLPKLADGPFAGYPRVFGLAWAFVAHTDSHFDPEILSRFIVAYQSVQPLTIGELWAVSITLRIVLIENLRRLAEQITIGRREYALADAFADRVLLQGAAVSAAEADAMAGASKPLSERFAAHLAKRLRDQDPTLLPALGWLEDQLNMQNTTVDDVVRHYQQHQGAANVTVRNIITSMRLISDVDWTELFERVSLVDVRLGAASGFAAMDFPTRNLYRSAIEQLARGSGMTELEVVDHVLDAAAMSARLATDPAVAGRVGDPGYHLIAEGRRALERAIGFRPSARLWISRLSIRLGIRGYVLAIFAVTALILAFAAGMLAALGVGVAWLAAFAVLGFVPASDVATALVNRAVTWNFGASALPGLELANGVPESLRTLVAVPTLLGNEADLREQIERLEVHHLAGAGGELAFALLADGVDAEHEELAGDAPLLAVAAAAIAALNQRYGPCPGGGDRFLLLHRRRLFNPAEGMWMGWERKRGKLHELNRLLRGAADTTFVPVAGLTQTLPADVRYVLTLDADTRLPRDAALRLIGKMAHPLNRPSFSADGRRITDGYGILQPRVTPALPLGREGSLFQRVFSGPSGVDPYAAAVSDVYQDLFGEGSYTGKGIYDLDAFETALAGRVPDNAMLSHDLFEGVFARAGLASDIEVVEEFPARYDVAAKRRHRWMRGDWQLLPWVLGAQAATPDLPPVGRWKMVDNLRRSLQAPFILALLALVWLLPMPAGIVGGGFVLATLAVPAFLASLFAILPRVGVGMLSHAAALGADLRLAALQTLLNAAFLADEAWRAGDAIVRTLARLAISREHLLEWTTAAQSGGKPRLGLPGFYAEMGAGTALGLALAIGACAANPAAWPAILPFGVLWAIAPALAMWASRSPPVPHKTALSDAGQRDMRLIALRTWRYFVTFVTPADNMLPPDNFQEDPHPTVAHRTSPTNIGLYLLSAIVARDFGWAGTRETVDRLEATFATLAKMPRYRGHLFNWYDTRDLRVLDPAYVSSVDSGNLAGHLIAAANACEEWLDGQASAELRQGVADLVAVAVQALAGLPIASGERGRRLGATLAEIEVQLHGAQAGTSLFPTLMRLSDKAGRAAAEIVGMDRDAASQDLIFWTEALKRVVGEHQRDAAESRDPSPLRQRLQALADAARELAEGMEFGFLLDADRKLLAIGYSLSDRRVDENCYDLLASEARLASLFAIAKGDVPTRHWFRLGRSAIPVGSGSALISWSGSMFEYLMPSLVMRAPVGSLLEQTSRLVVARQQSYARALGVPWGISESAFNARDLEFTYQYSNFGVPGLGLKRGLASNTVIAPYATGLAAMVDPQGAHRNYARLLGIGALGRHGFYEAIDYTPSRLPDGAEMAIVRSYMAHHQGMTIVAIGNLLHDGAMRLRFHREPMIQASELLLQERMPRDAPTMKSHPDAEKLFPEDPGADVSASRRVRASAPGPPITHLLSNGRYAVMLTASGMGYSRWRDIAVTRWREDATCDLMGSRIFLRDVQSEQVRSAAMQPNEIDADAGDVVFGEDHARFTRRDGPLTTVLDVLVSGEDDGEVRRVSLTNSSSRRREIAITSYSEVVLTTPAADAAHPAFAKLFVETEYLPEFGALIATRRPRADDEPHAWAAHFAVVEGDVAADPEHETDRARFLGRCHSVETAPAVIDGLPLSGTVGTVLDPIFALRQRVVVSPGEVVRVAFWTVVAGSREKLLELIDKHHDRNAFGRAKTLAWTQAQVQLRHLDIDAEQAADFQRLAAPLLYADARFRPHSDVILRGAGPQSGLWAHGISGDLPIVLVRIDEAEDMPLLREVLKAHEYWRMKRLAVDLVIVNERASSYIQDLQNAIETAVRSSQSRPRFGGDSAKGSVVALRADLISLDARVLLQSVARIVLNARRGLIAEQLARLPQPRIRPLPIRRRRAFAAAPQPPSAAAEALEFFNGLGGFDRDGREYVVHLGPGQTTPAPWINVIANPVFGFQVSAEGSGFTWADNSRENQITPWSNDPVIDPVGEAIYVRDEVTGEVWGATAQPVRDDGLYVARHGFGYSRFTHEAGGISLDLLQYVPVADPIKISRLTLTNLSDRPRRLSVTAYAEWVLGTSRGASAPFVTTEIEASTGAMFARNRWGLAFPGRVGFADLGGRQTGWTADRTEFLGRDGNTATPAALARSVPLSGRIGAGLDPCAALRCIVDLVPGDSVEVVSFLGQSASAEDARDLVVRYREANLDAVFADVTAQWEKLLGAVQVRTPDRAMDILLNGWLLYQTIACRVWARSAFYQASGAYGFRDQIQDGMALSLAMPEETRAHLLRAAARQFVEGDVQHWWLPHSGAGVRTRISDDRAWLAYAVAIYVATSGDKSILDERVPFLEGALLHPDEESAFYQPLVAETTASVFEHCALGLDRSLETLGVHGLPLIGTGDWNDGMSRVGARGKGESVWLGWMVLRTVDLFAPLAETRAAERAASWRAQAIALRAAIEREAWDGDWYRRATFDDGTWLGSKDSEECRIDSIAQSWAVLSGAADPARAATAMASLDRHLIRRDDQLALLFAPPFDKTHHDPGYIKGYPPGLRENGGQYSHAAMWSILAHARLSDGDKAAELFALLNPINHARTPGDVARYKVEPYVVAADVYSVAPHVGRGGWTWYTGSAGWMYRAGVEGLLGVRREGEVLLVAPCLPKSWPEFSLVVTVTETRYDIRVAAKEAGASPRATCDGVETGCPGGQARLPLDGGRHRFEMWV
ncbi:Protein NdvB [uncultured Alphaproteobacteria bacterium]|uniref:Protein NdvB n=1 Tax=uncultured Alphaproteobacteria bacterium TaxID=91750 RepID=A0A212ITH7_9PROT|nr:Protein NdvB [uncultured Alphaproteobacteria bacterium]